MGTWNYRAVTKIVGQHEEVGIYSVYYNDNGQPNGVSMEPAHVMSYSIEELSATLELMQECLKQPILVWEKIGNKE